MDCEKHYFPELLSGFQIRGAHLRNRIVSSPMCQYASEDGVPGDRQLVSFGRFALGGAALIFTEETAVEAIGRKTHRCAGLWNNSQITGHRNLTNFIHSYGALAGIQLGHAGGKGSCHGPESGWRKLNAADGGQGFVPWTCVGPSRVHDATGCQHVAQLSISEIRRVVRRWRDAALRAVDAGYDVVEVHGAHGYLIHQFLSPITNRRSDSYGKSRHGRMRFALEAVEEVRAAIPKSMPLFFRVSVVDGKGGSWCLEDTIVLSKELRDRGVDIVDCSSGGIIGETNMPIVRRIPGYHVQFSKQVRAASDVATMVSGLITHGVQAEDIIQSKGADLIAVARELIVNPNWPLSAARELIGDLAFNMLPRDQAERLLRREEESRSLCG